VEVTLPSGAALTELRSATQYGEKNLIRVVLKVGFSARIKAESLARSLAERAILRNSNATAEYDLSLRTR
jgi:hypothetical protein